MTELEKILADDKQIRFRALFLPKMEFALLREYPWLIKHYINHQVEIDMSSYIQPKVIHNDPALFEISNEEAYKMRMSYVKTRLRELRIIEKDYEHYRAHCHKMCDEFADILLRDVRKKIYKLEQTKKHYAVGGFKGKDIAELREIPLDTFITTAPIFISEKSNRYLCPLHNEKTGSFYWHKDKNKGHCYGCSWHGSVIDLYMKLNDLTVSEAVDKLRHLVT